MEFINEEFIKTNELNDTQVAAITKGGADYIANLQKDWEGKANENAEGILHGATKAVQDLTGISHENGQKIADYLKIAGEGYLSGGKASLERSQKELDEKIKNAGGDETLKAELVSSKEKIEGLQKIEAEHSEWVKGDYKNLFEKSDGELSDMKKQVAFGNVKPKFADGVNEYEAKSKWNSFKSSTLEKYDIHLDENNEALYVDKENKFKTGKVSDLVKENQEIQGLVKGRQQFGPGADPKNNVDIEGVPFKVPTESTSAERSKLINDYLDTKGIAKTDPARAKTFMELNAKILKSKTV
jgi:hypothetical protein